MKRIIPTLGLALAMGFGVFAAVGGQRAERVSAANGDYMVSGDFTSWETNGYSMTDNGGGIYSATGAATKAGRFGIKQKSGGSAWYSSLYINRSDPFTNSTLGGKSEEAENIYVRYAGNYTYTFKSTSPQTITISGTYTDTHSTVFSVTFASAVPEYVDVYLTGTFNQWGSDYKMSPTSEARTTFSVTKTVPAGWSEYSINFCYSIKGFDWEHKYYNSNQTIEVTDSGTVNLGSLAAYDFASKMPNSFVKSGAKLQITFDHALSTNITLHAVGGFNSWNTTTPATTLMTTEDNLTFSYTVPDATPAGNGKEFKIVIAPEGATSLTWDYEAYPRTGDNATINMPVDTDYFRIEGGDAQESGYSNYASVKLFSLGFIEDMEAICGTTEDSWNVNHAGAALNTAWASGSTNFAKLSVEAKSKFASDNDSDIAQARSLYLHCLGRYHLDPWDGAPAASTRVAPATLATSKETNMTIIIVVASTIALITVAGCFLLKRKEK